MESVTVLVCACGCGQPVTSRKPDARFVHGHNRRLARRPCECGCGSFPTRPSFRFLPGHHMYVRGNRWPICSGCGKKSPRPGCKQETWDSAANSYRCKNCRRTEVICRRCGMSTMLAAGRIRNLKSLQVIDGRHLYLCRSCQAHDRQRTVAKQSLAAEYMKSSTAEGLKEHMKTVVSGIGGHAALHAMRDSARRRGISDRARQRLSIRKLINTRRAGRFQLCSICNLLLYLDPGRVRDGALGVHGQCWREYMTTPAYLGWRKLVGNTASPRYAGRVAKNPHASSTKGARATRDT